MKVRVISAVVALAIFIPILLAGGMIFDIAICILAILALKEFMDIKETKKTIPDFMKFVSYLLIVLIVLFNLNSSELVFAIDYKVVSALLLGCLLPVIVYHDRKLYSVNDAFYLIGGIFFLGTSFSLFSLLRSTGLTYVIYLLLISMITDTYAYITGMLIGRHKLLPDVSPKKTWEGFVGGILIATGLALVFAFSCSAGGCDLLPGVLDFEHWYNVVILAVGMPLIANIGDFAFSAIKRNFGIKDFGNIIPGHGGVLDRLDSVLFTFIFVACLLTLMSNGWWFLN